MGRLDRTRPETLAVYAIRGPLKYEKLARITLAQYDAYDAALSTLAAFEHWTQTIDIVRANEAALNDHIAALASLPPTFDLPPATVSQGYFDLNRLLLNFLSAAKTFLDHTHTFLSRNYCPSEAKNFEEATNKAYDSVWEYRFFSRLRNYSQHCGFPLSLAEFSGTRNERTGRQRHTLTYSFSITHLLATFDGWSTFRKELEAMGDSIPLTTQPKTYRQELEALHKLAVYIQSPKLLAARTVVKDLLPGSDGSSEMAVGQ